MKLIYWNHFAAGFGVFLFRSSKSIDRTFSSDSLIYQRSGNMSDVFIQADKAQEDHSDKAKQVETRALRRQSRDPLVGS